MSNCEIECRVHKEQILKYKPHGCEYAMPYDNYAYLFTRHDDSEEWVFVDQEHCIAEGLNHYEVYKYFGKEKWYVDLLFDYAHKYEWQNYDLQ